MNTINKLAPLIVILAIIILGFFVYNYFVGGDDEPEETVLSPDTTSESGGLAGDASDTSSVESRVIGEELVRLRRRLSRINISADIVTSDRFGFLRDITEPVPSVDFGRDNPFLPTGL